jgi:hypothetical protein
MLYELRRLVGGSVVVLHHSKKRKWYKRALLLTGYTECRDEEQPKFLSLWNANDGFRLPPCKTNPRHVEHLGKRFSTRLLKGCKTLLEVLPEEATLSQRAAELNIPVTLLQVAGEEASSVEKRLTGEIDGHQS